MAEASNQRDIAENSQRIIRHLVDFNKELPNESEGRDDIDINYHADGVYLFVSFDIVNSTRYKSIEPDWPLLINKFYDESVQKISIIDEQFKVWKLIGDEILFYIKIYNMEKIFDWPHKLEIMMKDLTTLLNKAYPLSEGLIDLKGTVFIANLMNINNLKEKTPLDKNKNFIMESTDKNFSDSDDYSLVTKDFLGPDIDLGFRLTKHTYKNQILFSLELVYLIIEYLDYKSSITGYPTDHNDSFRVMSLVNLKGIWQERKYPVIWYKSNPNSWDKNNLFDYDDDYLNSKELAFYRENYIENKTFKLKSYLEKVLKQSGKMSKIYDIKEAINKNIHNTTMNIRDAKGNISLNRTTEVHYIIIGIDENKKVVLFEKENSESFYDCGCVHGSGLKKIEELLFDYYQICFDFDKMLKNEFNLPIPIRMFQYERSENEIVPGFIFVAKVKNVKGCPKGYIDYKLFDESEIDDINTHPDLKSNIKIAYSSLLKQS